MNEAQDLRRLIDRTKQRPNSLHRNKAVSHMEDAAAHLELMDQNRPFSPPQGQQPINGYNIVNSAGGPGRFIRSPQATDAPTFDENNCICADGRINLKCSVHGL